MVSQQINEEERLYGEGVKYVIMPHILGAKHFSTMIENNKLSMNSFLKDKIKHLEHLAQRKSISRKHT